MYKPWIHFSIFSQEYLMSLTIHLLRVAGKNAVKDSMKVIKIIRSKKCLYLRNK